MSRSARYDPRNLNIDQFTTKDRSRSETPLEQSQNLPTIGKTSDERRIWQDQNSEVNPKLRPQFMDGSARWQPDKVPGMLVKSQAQILTAPGTYTPAGTLRGSQAVVGPKAISAVHTYNDVSPAINTECAHDSRSWAPATSLTWDATVQRQGTARLHSDDQLASGTLTAGQMMMVTNKHGRNSALVQAPAKPPTVGSVVASRSTALPAPGGEAADGLRAASVGRFWTRMNVSAGGFNLALHDLVRSQDDLGLRAVPASHNCRLVGGQWRYVERPVAGKSLFTDFYGRCGPENGNYYGRSWPHVAQ
ncbi:hypothetical protein V8C86DRAFT_2644472 [Haematococcus lacustris]|nr:hypothetical protein QJQ45_027080 [Haematococcus lacustris]